jgi:hypothetical protein
MTGTALHCPALRGLVFQQKLDRKQIAPLSIASEISGVFDEFEGAAKGKWQL